MRPLEDHARHLDYLLDRLLEPNSTLSRLGDPGELDFEWVQVRQWLTMVAGLRYVDVVPVQNNYWGMCERAEEYDDEKNYLVQRRGNRRNSASVHVGRHRTPHEDAAAPQAL